MIQYRLSKTAGLLIISLIGLCLQNCTIPDQISTYPPIEGLATSDLYTVTVNGKRAWTEKFRTDMELDKLPGWFTSEPYTQVQQEVHICNLAGEGTMSVHIEVSQPVRTVKIRPLSRNIRPHIEGNSIDFSLSGPDKLYIEVGDLAPLCLFINQPEADIPDKTASGIHYFGPGVHRPGLISLKDHETLYLAPGAIVYGGIRVNGASQVRVLGHGILDGGFEQRRMVLLENGDQIEFSGITIRNGRGWTNSLVNCTNVTYRDIRVISFGPSGDGINPLGSRHVSIDNCFLRCTDDCIAIKSPDSTLAVQDIRITNNTMIGYAFSDGATIGFETNGPVVEDVTVRNCDILMARGGSRVEGHAAFSVICDGPAIIRHITFEDIRVEQPVLKLFELNITDGTLYGVNAPGHIQDIHLKNISWEKAAPIVLRGFDKEHRVNGVTFEQCTVEGKLLTGLENEIFRINDFTENISFR